MDKVDIISAAFRAWGREGYRKMSLSDVAAELGVTKPALYRHFRDKNVLFAEMEEAFFDRYARMISAAAPDGFAAAAADSRALLRYAEALAGYFGANRDELAFLFGRIMTTENPEALFKEALLRRGVETPSSQNENPETIIRMGISVTTSFFLVAMFHLRRGKAGTASAPTDEELGSLVQSVGGLCARGLGFQPGAAAGTDYAALDEIARLSAEETAAPDGLLPAVAAVVAEVGSWHASMEMVAKRSGLSKSGLYAHFKSKEDMLARLFKSEFERITAAIENRCARTGSSSDRLYVATKTTASYLLARPDVLVALDWVRTQRMGLGDLMPENLRRAFEFLEKDAAAGKATLLPGGLTVTVRWVLFLTIHQLITCKNSEVAADPAKRSLRTLHEFLLNGIGGL